MQISLHYLFIELIHIVKVRNALFIVKLVVFMFSLTRKFKRWKIIRSQLLCSPIFLCVCRQLFIFPCNNSQIMLNWHNELFSKSVWIETFRCSFDLILIFVLISPQKLVVKLFRLMGNMQIKIDKCRKAVWIQYTSEILRRPKFFGKVSQFVLTLQSNFKEGWEIFANFVAFLQYLNFR